jgi:hypothetical protein
MAHGVGVSVPVGRKYSIAIVLTIQLRSLCDAPWTDLTRRICRGVCPVCLRKTLVKWVVAVLLPHPGLGGFLSLTSDSKRAVDRHRLVVR